MRRQLHERSNVCMHMTCTIGLLNGRRGPEGLVTSGLNSPLRLTSSPGMRQVARAVAAHAATLEQFHPREAVELAGSSARLRWDTELVRPRAGDRAQLSS
jgi:hypothetical protein